MDLWHVRHKYEPISQLEKEKDSHIPTWFSSYSHLSDHLVNWQFWLKTSQTSTKWQQILSAAPYMLKRKHEPHILDHNKFCCWIFSDHESGWLIQAGQGKILQEKHNLKSGAVLGKFQCCKQWQLTGNLYDAPVKI